MTIADKLVAVNDVKTAIRGAIEGHDVDMTGVPFTGYAGKIAEISGGLDLPEIGDEFAGGYYVGPIRFSDGLFATVISPRSTGEPSGNTRFKTNLTDDPGANDLFDPRVNMAALNLPSHTAANFCRDLTIGGYNDWLLPSPLQYMQMISEFYMRGWFGGTHDRNLNESLIYWTSCQSLVSVSDAIMGRVNTVNKYFGAEMAYFTKTFNQAVAVRAFRLEQLA